MNTSSISVDGLVSVKVDGLEELQANLEQLPKNVAHRVLRGTLKDAAEFLRQKIVEKAPQEIGGVHPGFLSEHFDSKIRVSSGELSGDAFVGPEGKMYYPGGDSEKGVATGKHPQKGGLVPVASVARFLEFGTLGPGDHRITPNHFITEAFEENKDGVITKIIQGIKDAIGRYLR